MPDTELEVLSAEACRALMHETAVGRIAFESGGFPVVFPVNYLMVGVAEDSWILIRTRLGNVIDEAPLRVGFQIDGIDPVHRVGWSVLVRGVLHHLGNQSSVHLPASATEPWVSDGRDAWLVVEPLLTSGRRLRSVDSGWGFHISGYL